MRDFTLEKYFKKNSKDKNKYLRYDVTIVNEQELKDLIILQNKLVFESFIPSMACLDYVTKANE